MHGDCIQSLPLDILYMCNSFDLNMYSSKNHPFVRFVLISFVPFSNIEFKFRYC